MENGSVEEIIRRRAEGRLTREQGPGFLREYREHPERFLPLIDRQYLTVDEWEDGVIRNLGWDAGIYQDNCPYFAECWKLFTATVMTVTLPAAAFPGEPDLKTVLVEFIRNGLVAGLCGEDPPRIETGALTDGTGAEFRTFNLVLSEDEQGQMIRWGRGYFRYDELNALNGEQ